MLKLTYITSNSDKFQEVKKMLPGIERMDFDLPEIQSMDPEEIITAKLEKAVDLVFDSHQRILMVEDVSINFDGCNGLPGPMIKWFYLSLGAEGLYKFAKAFGSTKAQATLVVGMKIPQRPPEFIRGVAEGTIVEPRGAEGFGFNPIFVPNGHAKTYAEMEMEERLAVNPRGLALRKVREYLENELSWKFPQA